MVSELRAEVVAPSACVSVGERVVFNGSGAEFVVIGVDDQNGRVELLRTKPGRTEREFPISLVPNRRSRLSLVRPFVLPPAED